jgi:hypothetical protein
MDNKWRIDKWCKTKLISFTYPHLLLIQSSIKENLDITPRFFRQRCNKIKQNQIKKQEPLTNNTFLNFNRKKKIQIRTHKVILEAWYKVSILGKPVETRD